MVFFTKPSEATVRGFIQQEKTLGFTYADVGATRGEPPVGFHAHQTRARLGEGEAAFASAKTALRRWAQFDTGWTELFPQDAPVEEGTTVAVVARVLGVWSLNSCRVVYVVDRPTLFAFGYGTLPGHAESGEERFEVSRGEEA